jgi:predicted DNA-binding transcriptional regulator AlpA
MRSLTFDQLYALPAVVDLMTAARALGIGRTKAYRLAHDGQFPVRLIRPGLQLPRPHRRPPQSTRHHNPPRGTTENQNTETQDVELSTRVT